MPNRKNTSSANELMPNSGVATSRHRNATKMNISAMNIGLRPNRSASPPRKSAPIRMPARLAALTRPCCAALMLYSTAISGSATPVMNTTKPSKNFPAAARERMRHCIAVIGVIPTAVPSAQIGRSSI